MKMKHCVTLIMTASLLGCAASLPAPSAPSAAPTPASLPDLQPNTGLVSTLAADFEYMVDLTADAEGNLYVAALDGVRKVAPDGQVTMLAEARNEVAFPDTDITTTIANPRSITIDRDGTLYLSRYGLVYKLKQDGTLTSLPGPQGDVGDGIAVDSHGNVFLASRHKDTIYKVTPEGTVSTFAGRNQNLEASPGPVGSGYVDGPGDQALFRMPSDLAIDSQDNLYVADSNNQAIRKISPDGVVSTLVGHGKDRPLPPSPIPGQPSPDLSEWLKDRVPVSTLAIDASGRLYATGLDNFIRVISPDGNMTILAGDGTQCRYIGLDSVRPDPEQCYRDGSGTSARFDGPSAIAVDGSGALYVIDGGTAFGERRIRKIR